MAVPPTSTPGPGEPAADPSMDDILASIRRILDEEDTKPVPKAGPVDGGGAAPEAEDVLDLEPSMMVPEPDESMPGPVPGPPPILSEPAPAAALRDAGPASAAVPVPVPLPLPGPVAAIPVAAVPVALPFELPPPVPQAPAPAAAAVPPATPPLVAPAAAASAAASVGALVRTLATERSTATHRGGPTIEDLVREEMRPLLKEWLDSHLPPLVERLVRAEIERVVNRTG